MRSIAVLVVVAALAAAACDRSGGEPPEPPPAPTVPSTLPPAPETEECADLVDPALGLLQGQLDALASVDIDPLDPAATLPALPELDAIAAELEDRMAGLCAAGELAGLLAGRLGELRPAGPMAERYVELLASRLGG